jgi:hypothetical protein
MLNIVDKVWLISLAHVIIIYSVDGGILAFCKIAAQQNYVMRRNKKGNALI